jgi:ABC-type uncharacterized transport system permease subunit
LIPALTDEAPPRRWTAILQIPFVVSLLVVISALAIGLGLIAATGASPRQTVVAFWLGAFSSSYAIGASLNRAVPLALVGLGFVLAARGNLINVGGEGQIAVGGMIAAAVALHGASELPRALAVGAPLFAGTVAGAFWGGLAGILKVKRGTNEVISTLLLNFVAVDLLYWSVQSVDLLRQPRTSASTAAESLEIPDIAKLPPLTLDVSSPMHIGIVIAAIVAIVTAIVLTRSLFGLRLRALGLNPFAARRAGISQNLQVAALALAGALGGLAGASMMQGDQHVLRVGFSSGYGFDGLVVGLLSRGSVIGVTASALFFAFLRSGGMSMEMLARVPSAIIWICQGIIVIAIAGSSAWLVPRGRDSGATL